MTILRQKDGRQFEAHRFDPQTVIKSDRFGKKGGYRVHPPRQDNSDLAETGVFYSDIDDAKQHLRANPSWGIWMKAKGGKPGLHYTDILIDGKPR
jgi:hypothetical protein